MKTVIIIEPDATLAGLYELELSEAGYRVIAVATAAQALQVPSFRTADLIVADIFDDGGALLESSMLRGLNIPLVLNASCSAGMVREFVSPGIVHVLKSSNIDMLKETIHSLLAAAASERLNAGRPSSARRAAGATGAGFRMPEYRGWELCHE